MAGISAGFVADQVGMAWGVHHMHYAIGEVVAVTPWSVDAVVVAGVIVGLVFATATHQLSRSQTAPACGTSTAGAQFERGRCVPRGKRAELGVRRRDGLSRR